MTDNRNSVSGSSLLSIFLYVSTLKSQLLQKRGDTEGVGGKGVIYLSTKNWLLKILDLYCCAHGDLKNQINMPVYFLPLEIASPGYTHFLGKFLTSHAVRQTIK